MDKYIYFLDEMILRRNHMTREKLSSEGNVQTTGHILISTQYYQVVVEYIAVNRYTAITIVIKHIIKHKAT